MSLRQRLTEDSGLRVRFRKAPEIMDTLPISKKEDDFANISASNMENGNLIDVDQLNKFRTLSKYRNERYEAYEMMMQDSIISAALEMYADDATQYNDDGQVIWVESDNQDIIKAGNRLLDVLGINANSWRYIYALCAYGDVYLQLFNEGDSTSIPSASTQQNVLRIKPEEAIRPLEEYIEYIPDPSCMFEIQNKGKTCGFVKAPTSTQNNKNTMYQGMYLSTVPRAGIELFNRLSFVHISLTESINRTPECLGIDDENGNTTYYRVKIGKSILDDAYSVTQDLKLLEDSLLLNRLTRSALVRLLEIEVGDMPKPEVESLLRRVKNMLEQKMSANTATGEARSYNAPGPMENIVYFPTKEGKGHITINNLGGDINVKDIADLDYFNNKKLAALKIPKQFLNFDAPEGLGNGTSLTKISSRYAHTIMRIQTAYCEGVTTLLNLFFISKGLVNYVNNFTVKMVSPATVEDAEREERKSTKISQAADLYDFFEGATDETRKKVLIQLLNDVIEEPELAELLENDNSTETPEDINTEGPGPQDNGDTLPPINMDNNDEFQDFNAEEETNEPEPESTTETETDITPEQ